MQRFEAAAAIGFTSIRNGNLATMSGPELFGGACLLIVFSDWRKYSL